MKKLLFLLLAILLYLPAFPAAASTVTPVRGKTIVVDPGHGGNDPGAVSEGVYEKDINLEIALKLKRILEKSGARVIMTRGGDYNLTASGPQYSVRRDLIKRLEIARRSGADMLISIHVNSFTRPVRGGAEVYYHPESERGRMLAGCIQSRLRTIPGNAGRGVKQGRCLVLSDSGMPSALVEVGFLSNRSERRKLQDNNYQSLLAGRIAGGVLEFYEKKYY